MPEVAPRRPRIAFVVDRFGVRYGGAEAYGVALVRELARDHDITIVARDRDPACGPDFPFIRLSSWKHWPSWVRVLLFAIRARAATRTGYDIVHSHMNGWCGDVEVLHVTPVRYNWRVRRLPRIRRLLSYLSPRVQAYLGMEARRVAPRAGHRVVAVSGLIADQFRAAYGQGRTVCVIPPGVSIPPPRDEAHRRRLRAELACSDTDHVCLLVARNPLRKGLPVILEALSLLPSSYKLLIVGSGEASMAFVRKWGEGELSARVLAVGEQADVGPYYECADMYVHPTLNDSFGMAPLEAMAFGLPVIMSPTPWCGFAAYVEQGEEGLLLDDPHDARQLARFMAQLVEDAALHDRLVEGGRRLAQRHGWARIADDYRELYRNIVRERAESDPPA